MKNQDLIDRLRGLYKMGPTSTNTEPEFGRRDFSEFIPAIQKEAATALEKAGWENAHLSKLLHEAAEEQWENYWEAQAEFLVHRNETTHGIPDYICYVYQDEIDSWVKEVNAEADREEERRDEREGR